MKAKKALDEVEHIPHDHLKMIYLIFKEFLELTTDGFIAIDKSNRIIEISRAYADWLGVSPEQATQLRIDELIPNTRLPTVRDEGGFEFDRPHRFEYGAHKGKIALCSRSVITVNNDHIAALSQIRLPEKSTELFKVFEDAYSELEYYKEAYRKNIQGEFDFDTMIGSSPRFLDVKEQAKKAARLDSTILLLGETGTGKEVFAQSIHNASPRVNHPFISVNCAAIPSELLESELFGYEEGAFSGASKKGRMGKFELAHNGTLFLDEIGDMPLSMQAKVLRALQDKEIERLGSNKRRKIDVRIIAATNNNLEQKIKDTTFRADLFYRINAITLNLPALRERREDIAIFAEHYLGMLNRKYKKGKRCSRSMLQALEHYAWPGNARELKNTIEWAFSFSEGEVLEDTDLPHQIVLQSKATHSGRAIREGSSLAGIMEKFETEILQHALERHHGNVESAARELGVHKTTLYRKLKVKPA